MMMGWVRWLFMNQSPGKRRMKNIRQIPLEGAMVRGFSNGFDRGFL